jgi:hypothetical protein
MDPSSLQAHLHQTVCSSNARPRRSVYILEGLCHDFIEVLGDHFKLHPAVFVAHDRLVELENRATGEGGGLPFLPSVIYDRDHISLKYHEPLILLTQPTDFRNLCNTSGRHIAATRLMGKFSKVVAARRKCTFWSWKTESGGWDCTCDIFLILRVIGC